MTRLLTAATRRRRRNSSRRKRRRLLRSLSTTLRCSRRPDPASSSLNNNSLKNDCNPSLTALRTSPYIDIPVLSVPATFRLSALRFDTRMFPTQVRRLADARYTRPTLSTMAALFLPGRSALIPHKCLCPFLASPHGRPPASHPVAYTRRAGDRQESRSASTPSIRCSQCLYIHAAHCFTSPFERRFSSTRGSVGSVNQGGLLRARAVLSVSRAARKKKRSRLRGEKVSIARDVFTRSSGSLLEALNLLEPVASLGLAVP